MSRVNPETNASDFDTAVLQINDIGEGLPSLLRRFLEGPVVVSGNHDFIPVRQRSQPVVEIFDVPQRALTKTVTRMDQHITIRDLRNSPVQTVGV